MNKVTISIPINNHFTCKQNKVSNKKSQWLKELKKNQTQKYDTFYKKLSSALRTHIDQKQRDGKRYSMETDAIRKLEKQSDKIGFKSRTVKVLLTQSCLTLCNPMDYRLQGCSIYGILQARILEWVTISFSRGSSWPRGETWPSLLYYRQILYCLSHKGFHFISDRIDKL